MQEERKKNKENPVQNFFDYNFPRKNDQNLNKFSNKENNKINFKDFIIKEGKIEDENNFVNLFDKDNEKIYKINLIETEKIITKISGNEEYFKDIIEKNITFKENKNFTSNEQDKADIIKDKIFEPLDVKNKIDRAYEFESRKLFFIF